MLIDESPTSALGGEQPASQDEFVNRQPLPRLLRSRRFYFRDSEREFHIEINVDFDGGWNYSTARPVWMRSS